MEGSYLKIRFTVFGLKPWSQLANLYRKHNLLSENVQLYSKWKITLNILYKIHLTQDVKAVFLTVVCFCSQLWKIKSWQQTEKPPWFQFAERTSVSTLLCALTFIVLTLCNSQVIYLPTQCFFLFRAFSNFSVLWHKTSCIYLSAQRASIKLLSVQVVACLWDSVFSSSANLKS